MKINSVTTILTCPDRNYLIVKVVCDNGIVGYGDATLNGRELAVKSTIDCHLGPWLAGCDPDRIEDIWQMVFKHTYWRGGPVLMTALAGIDMALWDIKGKRYQAPVYSLLGGKCRDRLTAYTHVHGTDCDELLTRCAERVKSGCRALRYSFDTPDPWTPGVFFRQPYQDPVGGERIEVSGAVTAADYGSWDSATYIEDLVTVTEKVRKQVGTRIALIHDVHGRLSPIEAARVASLLEPYGLFFLEDPVEPMQSTALETVRRSSSTPLAIGELYNTLHECVPPVENQWIDFLRVDISHFGGISAVKKAADFSSLYGVKLACHGPTDISPVAYAATIHVDLSVTNFGIQEYADHGANTYALFDVGYRYADGSLTIDDRPGLGVRFNEEAAAEFPYRPGYLPGLRDLEGGVHSW